MSRSWVVIYNGNILEADLLRSVLESDGIESVLQDEYLGAIAAPYVAAGGAGAVKVAVNPEDAQRARRIAEDLFRPGPSSLPPG
jgi:hypothetical protein